MLRDLAPERIAPPVLCRGVLWLRFAKLLSVLVLVAGSVAAVFPGLDGASRRRFAYMVAGPGFGATWISGLLLVFLRGHSMFAPWILGGLVASLVSLQGVLFAAGRQRTSPAIALLTILPLVLTLWLMIWRPG